MHSFRKERSLSEPCPKCPKCPKGLECFKKLRLPSQVKYLQRYVSQVPQVSILTLDGRVIVSYTGYDKHIALLSHGAAIGAAKLWYDKPHQHFYLLLSLELEVADPTPETHTAIVGVDVVQRYLVVTAT